MVIFWSFFKINVLYKNKKGSPFLRNPFCIDKFLVPEERLELSRARGPGDFESNPDIKQNLNKIN